MLRIYFDNCCYNRPFDDLRQEKVALEAKAVEDIIVKLSNGEIEIYTSGAVEYELRAISEGAKKRQVEDLYDLTDVKYIRNSREIKIRAGELMKQNLNHMDAYHIAYAEKEGVDYLITTDKQMLNAGKNSDTKVKIINPVKFIMEVV